MTLRLRILRRAREDAQHIYDYLKARSEQGAANWWRAFEDSARQAATGLIDYSTAPENDMASLHLQQVLFKTRQGRVYRFIFTVIEDELRILRVRGPGQAKLTQDELPRTDEK